MGDGDPLDELHRSGHDIHFLSRLLRVDAAQADLALRLYRSPEIVRAVFADPACPVDAARVAVPLAEGDDPARVPHVVIARDGGFVTCLGAGMDIAPLSAIPWSRIATHLRRADERLAVQARIRETLDGDSLDRMIERLFSAGSALTREEFAALAAVEPLFAHELPVVLFRATAMVMNEARLLSRFKRSDPRLVEPLRRWWDSLHLIGHLSLLMGVAGRRIWQAWEARPLRADPYNVLLLPARFGYLPLALKVFWTIARAGRYVMPTLKRQLDAAESAYQWTPIVVALASVASRSQRLRAEALGLLNGSRLSPDLRTKADVVQWVGEVRSFLVKHLEEMPDDPLLLERMALGLFDPDRQWDDKVVEAAVGSTRLANIELDYIEERDGISHALDFAPLLVRLPPERFYYPAQLIDAAPQFTPDKALALASFNPPGPPVRAAPRPGRNEPCPCGSGKKHKKCCGAASR